mgnify:CR=1 FL=1|tara:strand:+ start:11560 stop:12018 length:459 start_codon:yes stop_codon:yes gene_type:complete
MTIITGNAHWAAIKTPNTTFDPQWQIDVTLDAENKAIVEGTGLNIKNKGDARGDFVSLKRKVTRANGEANQAPTLIDRQNRPMTPVLIGNGSDVNVKFKAFEYDNSFGKGVSADLQSVQVVNLVEYEGADDDSFGAIDAPDADAFDSLPLSA